MRQAAFNRPVNFRIPKSPQQDSAEGVNFFFDRIMPFSC
ncbi:hypothetical protein FM107_02890 [Sphingobacterium sp. JB170]|nr:hypothetical protein FM107_02890 [Sphingobacterium sp. JB170]